MDLDRLRGLLLSPLALRGFDIVDSTNTLAKAWAREGAPSGATVFSDAQTAGRGRLGRGFFSPGGGLYMSTVLDTGGASPGLITTLAAVCVLRAVKALTGQTLQIKWVNDLLLHGRKVCGILAEGVLTPEGAPRTVLGIGVNTAPGDFPADIAWKAGSLATEGVPIDLEALAVGILNELVAGLQRMPAHLEDYRAHCLTLGREVRFTQGEHSGYGGATAIDDEGALIIATPEGPLRLIAGEASVRGADGRYT